MGTNHQGEHQRPDKDLLNKKARDVAPGLWEDAAGHLHISVPDALKHFEMEDTAENRLMIQSVMMDIVKQMIPEVKFLYRKSKEDPGTFINKPQTHDDKRTD